MSEISTQIGQAIDTKPDTLSEAMLGLKRAKEALRESEERFRMVSELTSDWTYATRVKPDASVQIEWITEAFSRITGYTPQEVEEGSSWLDLIYPEDLLVVQRRVENLYSGRPDVSEYRIPQFPSPPG